MPILIHLKKVHESHLFLNKRVMKRIIILTFIALLGINCQAQDFNKYFTNNTLRLDYVFTGNKSKQHISLSNLYSIPKWYGKTRRLSETPVEGNGQIIVRDHATGDIIYKNSFSSLFQEWLTYDEAKGASRSFENVFLIPMPKDTVDINVDLRDNRRQISASYSHTVAPSDILIRRIGERDVTPYVTLQQAADSSRCIHIAIVAEGYKENEMENYINDANIALNAIFACAEIAVISVNGNHLKKMVAEGNRKAVRLQKLTEIPASFLATIQIAITLSGFLGSAFAADNFADRLLALFAGIGVAVPRSVIVILITILLSYVTLVFGELVPKRLAMKKTEQIALGLSGILTLVAKIFAPLVWLLTASTNGVLRLLRVNPEEEEEIVTEEEIRMMVDAGGEKGSIDSTEQELIHNIFAFDDISVNEICTHRTAVSVLWEKDSLEQWKETVHQSGHSFFPVCGEDIDDIRGVLSAKDIFRLSGDYGKEGLLSEVLRPAVFVPATVKADVLFANMKKSGNYNHGF